MQEKKKPRPLRILLRIFCVLLGLILLAAAILFVIPLTETVSVKRAEGSADWMARLEDGLGLHEIVIPGTHDSATQYSQLAFITKCQSLSVAEQLEAGYRYLDIRLGFADSGALKLMHGFTSCRKGPMPWAETLYLRDVLDQCGAFLAAHPTETVIFAVKYERVTEPVERFETRLVDELKSLGDALLLTDAIPTLGEARGKLVLTRRYKDEAGLGAEAGIPMLWREQDGQELPFGCAEDNRQSSYSLRVQDHFSLGTEEKWDCFRGGLREAGADPESLSIHFLSTKGTAKYGHPYHYAKALNPRLLQLPSEELRGWIVVDFADAALAEHIWSANFQ